MLFVREVPIVNPLIDALPPVVLNVPIEGEVALIRIPEIVTSSDLFIPVQSYVIVINELEIEIVVFRTLLPFAEIMLPTDGSN